ncbi:hypothetical protein JHK85_006337 [Glycine max]|uniref:Uncharacterized protein n=1 Tax=Glycine soja TaxID=3848 RepID=A0A0B2RTN4_GLYSO|nr:hypothetical protein JHK85_006337 [Glycine max]KHN35629.1 hypothetical protein glysoja_030981 [Glycine soja]
MWNYEPFCCKYGTVVQHERCDSSMQRKLDCFLTGDIKTKFDTNNANWQKGNLSKEIVDHHF